MTKYYTNQNITFNLYSLYDIQMKEDDAAGLDNKVVHYCVALTVSL